MRFHFDAAKPILGALLAVLACAAGTRAQNRSSAFLDGVSLTLTSGDDGLRDDSRVAVLVRFRSGVVREVPTPVVGNDARHAELHYDNLGEPLRDELGPVSSIEALGLRFRQGRSGFPRGTDNFTMASLRVSLTGHSQAYAWEVSNNSDVAHRFRGDEDYFPGGLSVVARPMSCSADTDCDDGLFCKGVEQCLPGDPRADARGCVTSTPCDTKDFCSETAMACLPNGCQIPDRDGDGIRRIECGGTDCDDDDAARFPGNPEVCDAEHHDEDCDARTFGGRDADGDGHVDSRCCNLQGNGPPLCGTDCDDNRTVIIPGAQTCGSQGTVLLCTHTGQFEVIGCFAGESCSLQPNGLGICVRDACSCSTVP
jgi:hypothetical protein